MTVPQAEKFLSRIKGLSSDNPISIYNNAVRRQAAEAMKNALERAAKNAASSSLKRIINEGAKRSKKLSKAVPVVGTVMVGYFLAEDAEAYGTGPATVNAAIDTIPLVGTGKIIAETYHGYRFIDVIVGPKKVQPTETTCP